VSAQTLDERYGARSPRRRRVIIAASTVLALAFLGWLGWVVYETLTPKVTSSLERFQIVDDHTATAVVAVSLSSTDVEATCQLRAYASDHTTVGATSFTPDPSKGQAQTVQIKTERRATAIESLGCTAPGQDKPR
jgi:hypothetical protein